MRRRIALAPADAVVAAGALGLGAAVLALFALPYDDAFIHLRIARNLVEHGQPYFNLGERVLGTSSPLWTLLLAAGFALRGTARYAGVGWVEAGIVALTAVLAHRLLAGRVPGTAATAAFALLAAATLAPSAGGGMETPLALLLLTAGALALARGRPATAGVLLALGAAARYELFVAAPAALAAVGGGGRRRLALGFAAVAGVEALGLLAVYGTVVPHTVRAKAVVYRLTLAEFAGQVPGPPGVPPAAVLGVLLASLALVGAGLLGLALAPGRLRAASPEHRALAVLGALPAALALVYAATRPLIFPWYWPLALFPAVLGTALAAARWRPVADAWPSPRARLARRACAAVAAVPVLAAAASAVETAGDLRALTVGGAPSSTAVTANARIRTYLELGAALAACRPEAVLAAEIGALGWAHRGRIIDGVALVSPEVLPFHPLRVPDERRAGTVGAYPARAAAALRPDLIVALEVFHSDFAAKAPADPALRRYAVLHARPVFAPSLGALRLPADLWYSRAVLVLGDPARCPPAAFPPAR